MKEKFFFVRRLWLAPVALSLFALALTARGADLLDTVLNTPSAAQTNTASVVSADSLDISLPPAPAAAEAPEALSSNADTAQDDVFVRDAEVPAVDGVRQSPEHAGRGSNKREKSRKARFSASGKQDSPSKRQKEPVTVQHVDSSGLDPDVTASHASSDAAGTTLTLSIASINLGSSQNYPEKGLLLSLIDMSNADYSGIRLSALDVVYGDMGGIQFGVVAGCGGKLDGMQVGAINYAGRLNGLQVGFLNIAESGYGAQIGLLNFILDNKIPMMPLINIGF